MDKEDNKFYICVGICMMCEEKSFVKTDKGNFLIACEMCEDVVRLTEEVDEKSRRRCG